MKTEKVIMRMIKGMLVMIVGVLWSVLTFPIWIPLLLIGTAYDVGGKPLSYDDSKWYLNMSELGYRFMRKLLRIETREE